MHNLVTCVWYFRHDVPPPGLLCRYYVGVLNKDTMEMELHSAQLFKMQPFIPGNKKKRIPLCHVSVNLVCQTFAFSLWL